MNKLAIKPDIELKSRKPTRSWIKGKKPEHVPVAKIRPTNTMNWEIREIRFSPILLVSADDDFYYIIDGNHRFYAKLCNHKSNFISAWVLEEGDQQRVHGNPLPTYVKEWRDGFFDLRQLFIMAKNAYNRLEIDINEDLKKCHDAINNEGKAGDYPNVEQSEDSELSNLTLTLTDSIFNLIKGATSVKEEAHKNNISEEQMGTYFKYFIDGGINAIRERLKRSKSQIEK